MFESGKKLREIFERRAKRALLLAMVGTTVTALFDTLAIALVYPLVSLATGGKNNAVVDHVRDLLGHPAHGQLVTELTVAVVALFVAKDLGSMAFAWWSTGFINTERVRTSARILESMLRAPYTELSRRSSAELMRSMDTAVLQVFSFTISGLLVTFSNSVSIVLILVALCVLAPIPTVLVLAYFGLASFLFRRLALARAAQAGRVMNDASLAGFRAAFAAFGARKEVSLRGSQAHFVGAYLSGQLLGAQAGRTASFLAALPKYLFEILFISAIGLVLVVGSQGASSSQGAVSLLALFVAAGFRLLPSVTSLLGNLASIRVGAASLDTVHQEVVVARRRLHDPVSTSEATFHFARELVCESVSFRYPGSEVNVLHDVTVTVPKGRSVAFVGASGAGKTTLVDLILGLHKPTGGRVAVDGRDIQDGLRSWQGLVGYVDQDAFLLDASLLANVAFDEDLDKVDRARVRQALQRARLTEVVEGLPDGLDTQIGERGTLLSGGQRQRVAIARALYREPQVLVLDEATSALDNETEAEITETIAALRGEVTVLIIAHRLSTVRHADQVVYLAAGRVRTVGSFDDVAARDPLFARLVKLGSLEPVGRD